jgi:hypothetical protein
LNLKRGGVFLLGVLAIFVTAALGFSGEAATRMAETVSSHVQSPWVPAAFIQIIAKSVTTRALPVGLWLWQQWVFVRGYVLLSVNPEITLSKT